MGVELSLSNMYSLNSGLAQKEIFVLGGQLPQLPLKIRYWLPE
jgi:hypothetical protein